MCTQIEDIKRNVIFNQLDLIKNELWNSSIKKKFIQDNNANIFKGVITNQTNNPVGYFLYIGNNNNNKCLLYSTQTLNWIEFDSQKSLFVPVSFSGRVPLPTGKYVYMKKLRITKDKNKENKNNLNNNDFKIIIDVLVFIPCELRKSLITTKKNRRIIKRNCGYIWLSKLNNEDKVYFNKID